ncbi:hypothetical protein JCM6882_009287 [Rhodosporidiobolus microsporus]
MGVFLPAQVSLLALAPSSLSPAVTSAPKGPEQANPLPTLIGVVVESILEVFFLCLVGWYLARKGIIDDKAKKTLNKINTSLFTPCLLFNKVAFSLTPDKLAELYIIPIGFCLISAFSATVAWLMGKAVGLKKGQRNFAIACATFQNSNSLPIALLQSLIGEKLPLAWGPHDTKDAMLGRGLSYLVLFSSLGIIVRWSIGVRLLSSAETENEPDADNDNDNDDQEAAQGSSSTAASASGESTLRASGSGSNGASKDVSEEEEGEDDGEEDEAEDARENSALLHHKRSSTGSILKNGNNNNNSAPRSRTSSNGGSKLVVLRDNPAPPPTTASTTSFGGPDATALAASSAARKDLKKKRARVFQSFPNTPAQSVYSASRATSEAGDFSSSSELDSDFEDDSDEEWGARRGFGRRFLLPPRHSWVRRAGRAVWRRTKKIARGVNEFMTVPLWAAILSLVVACIPPLQRVLNEAEPLKATIRSAGACSVPITLITLGAYFYRPSASATTSPLRPADDPSALNPTNAAPPPNAHETSFSSSLLRRLRNPFAPLPVRSNEERRAHRGERRTVAVAVVSRMVIVPAVLIPLFAYYAKVTVNVADDPVFVVVACLLIGSPAAVTLAQISSAAAGPTFELLISRTLLISYAFLTAPTTVLLVLAALWIDKLQHPHKIVYEPNPGSPHGPHAAAVVEVVHALFRR